jgi:nucleoside-diphosphate-sugar epimerase
VAQIIEQDPSVEIVVGLDTRAPTVPLERTEVVRADSSYSILSRLVRATEVDTILHTHLEVDSTTIGSRALHETNVIGTMNLLAAAGAPGSSVRKVVLKSSTLIYGSSPKDPYFFSEEAGRSGPARTRVERSLLEVEGYLSDFADDHPDVVVSRLRFSNVLGPDLDTPLSRALQLPVVPEIFGFDPRLQFTHQDDVLGALCFTALRDVPGIFNVDGTGRRRPAPPRDRRPAARGAEPAALRPGRRQPAVPGRRLPVPVHVGRHGGGLRPPPPTPGRRRRPSPRLPLRPGGGGLLPPVTGGREHPEPGPAPPPG